MRLLRRQVKVQFGEEEEDIGGLEISVSPRLGIS